jgi:uncharacterized protein YukE
VTGAKKELFFRKTISVHSPEAQDPAGAFGEARRSAEMNLSSLQDIITDLDREWEGGIRSRFRESLRTTSDRIRNILLPHLQSLEKKYREDAMERKTLSP